ncbi:DUF6229 family protein [Pyxidicoccus sp. 3LG]
MKLTDANVEEILAGWLSGAESAHGLSNPAGPLYVGGTATEASLTDSTLSLFTGCSSCTGSGDVHCC